MWPFGIHAHRRQNVVSSDRGFTWRKGVSYKGWEGKLLVVFVDSIDGNGGKLLYTAMTRLLKGTGTSGPSSLTVVSTCTSLQNFAQKWPEYEEHLKLN